MTGRVLRPGAPPLFGRRLGGGHPEWQRQRARRQRRGAETRALVGAGSGAGLRGRTKGGAGAELWSCRRTESSREQLEQSWRKRQLRRGCQASGLETASSDQEPRWVGAGLEACRSRACRRPPLQPRPRRGRKPAGWRGRRRQRVRVRALERGRRCVRARLSPLSSCHQQPLLLQQSGAGGKRLAAGPPRLPASPVLGTAGSLALSQRPACSRPPPGSRLPNFRAGFCMPLDASIRRVAGDLGLSPNPPSPYTYEGPHCRLAAVFRDPSPEESALTAASALVERSDASFRALQLQAGSLGRLLPERTGPRWSSELTPNPRPLKFSSFLFRGGGSAPWGGCSLGP